MPMKKIFLVALLICFYKINFAQTCTALGQNPSTAFPVCGTSTFYQATVPNCGGKSVPNPCPSKIFTDQNPYWYKFTCYQTGTLAFLIEPIDPLDDYDWQLFDVAGKNVNNVFTDASMFVACNWSGNVGNTGAAANNNGLVNCEGTSYPTFSSMPTVIQGHDYLLLLSHFTTFKPGDKGYNLSFGGGTAIITDTTKPLFQKANARCDGGTIVLVLNKRMQCRSLAPDGSDFEIQPGTPLIQSVSGVGCSSSFDLDSVIITLQQPLAPGNYSLIMKSGSDGNTLLDNCDTPVPENDSTGFTVYAIQPTPFDSIAPFTCASDVVRLVFRNQIKCSSIDAGGSDFVVTGSQAISVISASGENCNNGLSNIIDVKLDRKIETAGNFQIALQIGNDGNSILDECAQETPPNAVLSFASADTVNADFIPTLGLGCVYDTLFYFHNGNNNVNQWLWTFDVNGIDTLQQSYFLFDDYGIKNITLAVSNGVCTDTASYQVNLDNQLIAAFTTVPSYLELCPEDAAVFTDTSTGKIQTWFWSFGDGRTSTQKNPPPKYYPPAPTNKGVYYPVQLIVKNDINCYDTSNVILKVLGNCYIAVPTGFTPNGDGLNDYLYPLNAYKADNLIFRVFNRYGQLVFETTDWTRKWDGTIKGQPQSSGTYVWTLEYINKDDGEHISQKGTAVLIR